MNRIHDNDEKNLAKSHIEESPPITDDILRGNCLAYVSRYRIFSTKMFGKYVKAEFRSFVNQAVRGALKLVIK